LRLREFPKSRWQRRDFDWDAANFTLLLHVLARYTRITKPESLFFGMG
jgi:hypothetical protein